uniref:Uncharacterized protein n=1 Tax=Acrobeloides nanus TaxID=290746 RepID=A0A914E9K1_9BILA
MKTFFLVLAVIAVFCCIEAQQFSCTSNAQFSASFDRSQGSATCSNGVDLSGRCLGCCEAWGMSRGISKDQITGFVTSNGRSCSCCGNIRGGNVFVTSPNGK